MIREFIRYGQDESFILVDNEGNEGSGQEFARKKGKRFFKAIGIDHYEAIMEFISQKQLLILKTDEN